MVSKALDLLLPNSMHHKVIFCDLSINDDNVLAPDELSHFDCRNANYRAINDFLGSRDWYNLLYGLELDVDVDYFYCIFDASMNMFVPKKYTNHPAFLHGLIVTLNMLLLNLKKETHRQCKLWNLAGDEQFLQLRSMYKKMSQICYRNDLRRVEAELSNDPRSFWKYVNDHRGSFGLSRNMYYGNNHSGDGQKTANIFAKYFATVYAQQEVWFQY